MTDDSDIVFIEGSATTHQNVLETALVEFEQSLEERLGWRENVNVTLGIVSVSALAGIGSIQFELIDDNDIPTGVNHDPVNGFAIMVEFLVQGIRDSDPDTAEVMDHLSSGFVGWLYVAEGLEVGEEGEPPVRMMGYYNIGNGGFFALRRKKGEEPSHGWGRPDDFTGGNVVYEALEKLTRASHYVVIRRELFGDR